MNHKEIEDLIVLFLTGEISEEQWKCLQSWLGKSEENERYFDIQKEIWMSSMSLSEIKSYDPATGFAGFLTRKSNLQNTSKRARWKSRSIAKYAFVVFSVVVISAVGIYRSQLAKKPVEEICIEAPVSSVLSHTFPDGSNVSLNAGSKLSYDSNFGKSNRFVKLDGEAYFDVRHDAKKQFVIKTDRLEVRDLGTSFNVRDYSRDPDAQIALVQGKIAFSVSNGVSNVEMRPGEIANLEKNSGCTSISGGKIESAISWISGRYLFEDERLSSIVRKLERGFGVNITIQRESLGNLRFNGCFNGGKDDLDNIMTSLAKTGKIRIAKTTKGNYIIY